MATIAVLNTREAYARACAQKASPHQTAKMPSSAFLPAANRHPSLCPHAKLKSHNSMLLSSGYVGVTIDFLLSAKRDTAAAKRFLAKALGGANHPHPRVINTDKEAAYPPAIVELKAEGALVENCRHRPAQYLNNVLEQDHRAVTSPGRR
jgi:DDE superfamily endonuclease